MSPDPSIVIVLDASISCIEQVHDGLEELWREHPTVSELDRMALETALIELATNVVRYALREGSGDAELRLAADDRELTAQIVDQGREFSGDLSLLSMPALDAESGRGLAVIDLLMDVFEYRRTGPHNFWTIARRLTTPVVAL